MISVLLDSRTGETFYLINGKKYPYDPALIRHEMVCSAAQARIALAYVGMLEVTKAAVEASTDETLKISWEYGTEWSREDHKLISLAKSLGMTDEDIDNLFLKAMAVA